MLLEDREQKTALSFIELTALEFRYGEGDFVLRLPTLSIAAGEKVAVVGASGSGKTTLLHLLAGICLPHAGQIRVGDWQLDRLSDTERRRFRISQVGFIFQNFELLDYLNVLDNILHPYRLNPALKLNTTVRQRAAHLAEQVGIQDKLGRSVRALSQGEKQRVAICRALLPQPRLLLADEATGNLDSANKHRIVEILFEYVRNCDATLISVTHDRELLHHFERTIDLQALIRQSATDCI